MPFNAIKELIKRYHSEETDHGHYIDLARQTIAKIDQLNAQPDPIHFTVILESIQKVDPFLASEIQKTIDTNNYNNETAEALFIELFSQYISQQLPTEEVETLLITLLGQIELWLTSNQSSRDIIDTELKVISDSDLPENIRSTFNDKLIPAINSILSNTDKLNVDVSNAAEQINALKCELERTKRIAKTDELTSIPNRRGFNEKANELLLKAKISNQPFSLVSIDIDHFKTINDEFGHLIGDSVLRYLAKQLSKETKGKDLIARLGGEEFVVLLSNTEYQTAINVAENLRKKITKTKLEVVNLNKPLSLTISLGVATFMDGDEIEDMLDRADKAMYLAKQSGRNAVRGEIDI